MKLKEFFYLLGLRPKARSYGFVVGQQQYEGQTIQYAQWQHPRAYNGEISFDEVDRLKQFLRPGDVAVDIGAHSGDTTVPMAMAVGQTGHVIAFEANKFVFPTLEANSKLNPHLGKIHAFNLAVTEENRDYEFSYNDPGFMNGGAVEKTRAFRRGDAFRQTVRGVRLEDFIKEKYPELLAKIRYIKIDTEGSDLYILQSISSLIKRVRPYLQAEVMRRTPREYRLAMVDFLVSHDYVVYQHVGGKNSAEPMQRDEVLEGDDFDLFCQPREAVTKAA